MDHVIAFLNNRNGFVDACKVTLYRVYIHNREVNVELYDLGEDAGHVRYTVKASYAEVPAGRELEINTFGLSLGNPDATIEMALMNVHWNVFPDFN